MTTYSTAVGCPECGCTELAHRTGARTDTGTRLTAVCSCVGCGAELFLEMLLRVTKRGGR